MSRPSANLTRAQLFLDDSWIEEATFVHRQWHQARKYPDPVLTSEHPWEGGAPVIYGTVLHWRGKFRMWYIGWTRKPGRPKERVSYAESDDGVVWKKPHLGVCEFDGHRNNNVVLDAPASSLIDDIAVIDDIEDEEWPLKALYWQSSDVAGKAPFLGHDRRQRDWGIFAARSKDGIHWDRSPGLVLPHWIDRFNAVSTKLNGKYVVYGRAIDVHHTMVRNGRSVWRTESKDLIHWSAPRLVLERDPEDPLHMEYYSASVFTYEGLTLGGLERMYLAPDILDTELIWSHDHGVNWKRAPRRPSFLSPSTGARRWDDTWTSLPTNAPIRHQNRLWFYYSGRSTAHVNNHPRNHGAIGLATLRIDGFASLQAGERSAIVLTKPMRWPKADLHINVDPRRDLTSHPGFCSGELRAELRDASNRPIKGFTWDDCEPFTGNTVAAENSACPAVWKENKSARALAGRTIRIAFRFHDAHLYSFRASAL